MLISAAIASSLLIGAMTVILLVGVLLIPVERQRERTRHES